MSKNYNKYRDLVSGVNNLVPLSSGKKVTGINFDNAATTPPFESVLKSIIKFSPWYSSVHRGMGYKSRLTSELYDSSREKILKFVNADPEMYTVVFVKNTTEGINKLSYRLISDKNAVVLSTWMEHHSNDLPWRDKCRLDYVEIDDKGKLLINDLEEKLIKYKGAVRLVTVTGASNVTGYVNDIHKIAALAHKYNAKILVDGAQLVPHMKVNMMPENNMENIDFLVFSAHKMYAPYGIGVIIAPKKCLREGCPEYKGGGTVQIVTREYVDWDEPPFKEEAGSPNVIGVKALITAIEELNKIGMEDIDKFETSLTEYTIEKMKNIPEIKLYNDISGNAKKIGIIPFNVNGIDHYEVANALSQECGIAVRNGCFCAHPYVQKLLKISVKEMELYRNNKELERPGLVRISFGLYNTFKEVDTFIYDIEKIILNRLYGWN